MRNRCPCQADAYMRLAVFDLLGALFCTIRSDACLTPQRQAVRARLRRHQGPLRRIPILRLARVAAEAGISLRYLQKLFTARGSTCSHYISSLRLEHAARLIERPRPDEVRPASQRDCLRLRVSRLHPFCARLPSTFRPHAGAVGTSIARPAGQNRSDNSFDKIVRAFERGVVKTGVIAGDDLAGVALDAADEDRFAGPSGRRSLPSRRCAPHR